MSNRSYFVLSLDFELYWGMFDKVTLEQYGENIAGVHRAIPEMLALFSQYSIHATWATVGMLMSESKEELMSLLPPRQLQPAYSDPSLSSYAHIEKNTIGDGPHTDKYHYGAQLVRQIIATAGQELGSHTFSHYYCLDGKGNGKTFFAADCDAFLKAAKKFNAPVTSIVFPRNQTTEDALSACKEAGLKAYRGTPEHFLYTGKREKDQVHPLLRALRLADAYVNISGHHTFKLKDVSEPRMSNVRGSRFLRPYSPTLRALEPVRMRRIKKSMTYAAKHGEIFHLWWHPHNFGVNRKENLKNLTEILEHYQALKKEYGMHSANMREIATYANG
jgi:peptidoglycan/xylan/chitin deacetylase (PgdA/CDA1 family)